MALHEDLVIPQGKSWVGPMWALLDEDDGPYSLAGKVVRAQVRETARDAIVLHEWSTGNGTILTFDDVTVEVDGVPVQTAAIALAVKPSVSSAWGWRVGTYDVEVSDENDPENTWPVVEPSSVRVTPEVTR